MKKVLLVVSALMLSSSAFALHETACGSADGTLKRTEDEISGANPIKWTLIVDGKAREVSAEVVEDSKVSLEESSDSENGDHKDREVFAEKVTVSYLAKGAPGRHADAVSETKWVICESWKNKALDLVPRKPKQ